MLPIKTNLWKQFLNFFILKINQCFENELKNGTCLRRLFFQYYYRTGKENGKQTQKRMKNEYG